MRVIGDVHLLIDILDAMKVADRSGAAAPHWKPRRQHQF
jgi:hypothetical protein